MADPTKIGKYELLGVLGQGGMGKVYKALHPSMNRHVVIKQITGQSNKAMTQRFQREARIMMDFRFDNIVPVYDYFEERGRHFIVMEFVDGKSLEGVLKEHGPLDPTAAVTVFLEVCLGLRYAHEHGVVHRDIKPDNVLVSTRGEVKLADFGIARAADDSEEDLTATGIAMGTPAYMSPEQIDNAKRVDQRSDVYSMGVMLYQMVTAKRPFAGNMSPETIHKISLGKYTRPRRHNRAVPRPLERIIRKAMHRKPKRRYQDMTALIRAISRYALRFKTKFETHDEIRRYLFDHEAKTRLVEPMRSRGFVAFRIAAVVLGLAAVAGVGYGAYTAGYYHEHLRDHDHGAVQAIVDMPANYHLSAEEVAAYFDVRPVGLESTAALAAAGGGGTDAADGESADTAEAPNRGPLAAPDRYRVRLHPEAVSRQEDARVSAEDSAVLPAVGDDTASDGESASVAADRSTGFRLTSPRLYLPAGDYEASVIVGNSIRVVTFHLFPREIQRTRLATRDARIVEVDYTTSTSTKEIDLAIEAYDAVRNEPIQGRVTTRVSIDGARERVWPIYVSPFGSGVSPTLLSGRSYRFEVSSAGYLERTVEFEVPNESDVARARVYLVPRPGTLEVVSNSDRAVIRVDNRAEVYVAGARPEYAPFGRTIIGTNAYSLDPGDYVVTAEVGRKASAHRQVTVEPGQKVTLNVVYDETTKTLSIAAAQR